MTEDGGGTENESPERTEGDINISRRRRQWRNENLDARTRRLLDEDRRWFLQQSLSTPCLDAIESCDGSYITNLQGKSYLDFHGNSVHQAGYANPAIIDAVKQQLGGLPFCPRRFTNETAVRFAAKLAQIAPGALNKVLLAPGGAEAVGIALKLAKLYTGRFKTVSWWDSFHGATLDAISVGGERLFRAGMGPLVPGALHVPPPYSYSAPFGGAEGLASPGYIDYVMEREGDIAAFIAEPLRCTAVITPPQNYWREVREICDRHGALLIFDEIPICLGRTGRMFACEHFGVVPDILCIGKGLGGGVMPVAAAIAREDLDVAAHVALGHYTHEKSPVAAAAALAAIEFIENENLCARAAELGDYAHGRLVEMMDRHSIIGDVRSIGLVLGVELVTDRASKEPAVDEAEAVMYSCLEKGLSFKVSSGNVLTLMPPLTVSREELDTALDILDRSFCDL